MNARPLSFRARKPAPKRYTMPISQKAYAHHANISRGRVSQLCRQGMPLTSPEAADAWRGMTARQRPEASAAPPECLPRPSQPAPDL